MKNVVLEHVRKWCKVWRVERNTGVLRSAQNDRDYFLYNLWEDAIGNCDLFGIQPYPLPKIVPLPTKARAS